MIAACIKRGIVAGLLAGLLAGLAGLVVGEPSVDAAIRIEEAQAARTPADPSTPEAAEVTRPVQKIGLVAGTALVGIAVGAAFGVLMAWSIGRLQGDAWTRSLKATAVLLAATVLFPALKYPPNPPTVGDPATIKTRTTLYLGLAVIGLLLAAASYTAALTLRKTPLDAPSRQTILGSATLATATVILTLMPPLDEKINVPATLLWSFRTSSIAIQTLLLSATGILFGLLTTHTKHRQETLQ
jgi:hypothetical protein